MSTLPSGAGSGSIPFLWFKTELDEFWIREICFIGDRIGWQYHVLIATLLSLMLVPSLCLHHTIVILNNSAFTVLELPAWQFWKDSQPSLHQPYLIVVQQLPYFAKLNSGIKIHNLAILYSMECIEMPLVHVQSNFWIVSATSSATAYSAGLIKQCLILMLPFSQGT